MWGVNLEMALGRKLLDDVTINELMTMREEQGMSNQDIADALGVNVQTIYNYIGKMPKELYKPRTRKEPAVPAPGKVEEPAPEACLVVQNRTIELHGLENTYIIDSKKGEVLVNMSDESGMIINFDKLPALVNELRAIQRKISELTVKNEMW